jgi:hypothetical protein
MKMILIAFTFLSSIGVFAAKVGTQMQPFELGNIAGGKYGFIRFCTLESGLGGQRGQMKSLRCSNPNKADGVVEVSFPDSRTRMFLNDGQPNIGQWRNGGWALDATWITEDRVIFMLSR